MTQEIQTSADEQNKASCRPSEPAVEHTPTYWQTREVGFDKKIWAQLLPPKGPVTVVTAQSMAEVIAIVWGDDDAQEKANAKFIVKAANCHAPLVKALTDTLRELDYCQKQLEHQGRPPRLGGSVWLAIGAAKDALKMVEA